MNNSNLKESIMYRGYKIDTYYDYDCESPNDWGDEQRFIVYDHRQFYVKREGFNPSEIFDHIEETKKFFYDGFYVFPLYAYIHSGVALSLGNTGYPFNCRWDSSCSGFVLIQKEKSTWTRASAEKAAEGLVETWNQYLSGEVYGYNCPDSADSCWGYYGDAGYEQMIAEAKNNIDYHIKLKVRDHLIKLKVQIRNNVPFQYRVPCPL